ncbi:hypothetical protein DI487_03120 [Flavobacterium sediminis]|uniref:Uncharacterized protein n=1 Tax=Flavobacterium sediminis TaxID=2201181 RepID=A0A2U8QSU0_9FLAO|nr:hypothetical protein DI487_03120 [Flavobacterium sediminis]
MTKLLYIVLSLSFIMLLFSFLKFISMLIENDFVKAFLQLVPIFFFGIISIVIFLIIKKKEK